MKLTIKLNLDKKTFSDNELIEASKYLKLLSQHFEINLVKKIGTLAKRKEFAFNMDMPINDNNENKIGTYRVDKKEEIKDISEAELMKDLNEWSRKHFGYTKNGYLHYNGKKTKLSYDEDSEEWED